MSTTPTTVTCEPIPGERREAFVLGREIEANAADGPTEYWRVLVGRSTYRVPEERVDH